jgi:multiple sugar transport system substrate-binding protein
VDGGKDVSGADLSRRVFLRRAAGGAALLAAGAGCSSGSGTTTSRADAGSSKGGETLRIAKRTNYISGYDDWWNEQARRWGERNGVDVVVEYFDVNQAQVHAEAEAASQRGHDLFQLVASAAPFEDHVVDHRDVVEEVKAKFGTMTSFVERSVVNPKTGRYFAFSDAWNPSPVHYRTDLWEGVGQPAGWDDLLTAGPALKARGAPIGIGLGPDIESNAGLLGLLFSYGASVQDEDARVVINSPATLEAVKVATALFRSAMTDEVLGWDITSNNRYLVTGRGSLIINSVAALRALESQDAGLAAKTGLRPVPAGPAGRLGPYAVNVYMIWKFSKNQEAAKRFLVDLVGESQENLLRSAYLQIPSFPGAVGDLNELVAADSRSQPADKYRLLAGAAEWTTNMGYPGHTNAASQEVLDTSVISQMFASAAAGAMTAEEAVRTAEARTKAIYDKWREQGKI